MAVGHAPSLDFTERLEMIRPFADDPHFAVREWAWLSLRPHVVGSIVSAVGSLQSWVDEDSERLRRFSTEVTRPRGVWSTHIPALKADPTIGLPLLEPLIADPSRYVQDSVANWLNDASKTRGDWVDQKCSEWVQATESPHTRRICRRACRSL